MYLLLPRAPGYGACTYGNLVRTVGTGRNNLCNLSEQPHKHSRFHFIV